MGNVIPTQMTALVAVGWALSACVGPLRGVDVEVGTTVQYGKDPAHAPVWWKGCGSFDPCVPVSPTLPGYGGGIGVIGGAAANFPLGPFTLRPYLGARYEHYFELSAFAYSTPTNFFVLEGGLGVALSRLELRPTIGLGAEKITGNSSLIRVVTLGFSLSTRVVGGLIVGTFLHYNLSPIPDTYWWDSHRYFTSQSVDAPIVGLEAAYRFKVL